MHRKSTLLLNVQKVAKVITFCVHENCGLETWLTSVTRFQYIFGGVRSCAMRNFFVIYSFKQNYICTAVFALQIGKVLS